MPAAPLQDGLCRGSGSRQRSRIPLVGTPRSVPAVAEANLLVAAAVYGRGGGQRPHRKTIQSGSRLLPAGGRPVAAAGASSAAGTLAPRGDLLSCLGAPAVNIALGLMHLRRRLTYAHQHATQQQQQQHVPEQCVGRQTIPWLLRRQRARRCERGREQRGASPRAG